MTTRGIVSRTPSPGVLTMHKKSKHKVSISLPSGFRHKHSRWHVNVSPALHRFASSPAHLCTADKHETDSPAVLYAACRPAGFAVGVDPPVWIWRSLTGGSSSWPAPFVCCFLFLLLPSECHGLLILLFRAWIWLVVMECDPLIYCQGAQPGLGRVRSDAKLIRLSCRNDCFWKDNF